MSGVLRGSGRQFLGACINLVAFYVMGLPVGISLALAGKMGTVGIWIGLGVASFVQVCCDENLIEPREKQKIVLNVILKSILNSL